MRPLVIEMQSSENINVKKVAELVKKKSLKSGRTIRGKSDIHFKDNGAICIFTS